LEAVTPGSVLTLDFKGSCIGICVNSGPDAGMIEYSVDGAPFKKMDLYTKWSGILHLPWYLMLEEELKDKKHQLLLRVSGEKNEKSEGNAVRVVWFLGR
jgi:sialidase-1